MSEQKKEDVLSISEVPEKVLKTSGLEYLLSLLCPEIVKNELEYIGINEKGELIMTVNNENIKSSGTIMVPEEIIEE